MHPLPLTGGALHAPDDQAADSESMEVLLVTPAGAERRSPDELDELLAALPALALEGPKGVGKTRTALQRARTVHRLDDPAAIAVAEAVRVLAGIAGRH